MKVWIQVGKFPGRVSKERGSHVYPFGQLSIVRAFLELVGWG